MFENVVLKKYRTQKILKFRIRIKYVLLKEKPGWACSVNYPVYYTCRDSTTRTPRRHGHDVLRVGVLPQYYYTITAVASRCHPIKIYYYYYYDMTTVQRNNNIINCSPYNISSPRVDAAGLLQDDSCYRIIQHIFIRSFKMIWNGYTFLLRIVKTKCNSLNRHDNIIIILHLTAECLRDV